MAGQINIDTIKRLESIIDQAALHYSGTMPRYDAGDAVMWRIKGVCPAVEGEATLTLERFLGGGFAGQVYQARLDALQLDGGDIPGLEIGQSYAVKILVPPSRSSLIFRNVIYWLAYQGPFSAQVNPAAARTGVLWQKLIRRGADVQFGDDCCVADTYATFFDPRIGSFGEINEFVEGRNWRFEIDEEIFGRGKRDGDETSGSREYLAKKDFMARFVRLLHDMGAPELARQYEWGTWKSQPNVLKRLDAEEDPAAGLTAIDFRAGLALLPFLPMSPADLRLICKGLARGDLVQFDRGNLEKLETFCREHGEAFAGLEPAIEELNQVDPEYRASLPDLSHQGFRLLYDGKLRQRVREGAVQGWQAPKLVDEAHAPRLKGSFFKFWLFYLVGLLPFLGKRLRRFWGHADYARHIRAFFSSFDYMRRTWRAAAAEALVAWYRAGRVDERRVEFYLRHPVVFVGVRVFPGVLPLPGTWHRFITDWRFAWNATKDAVAYPIRFYRDAQFRVAWLTAEVESGADEGMLTEAEKQHILSRVPDPFIQKYLKCVAVHICTLPITQVIALLFAAYAWIRFAETWQEGLIWAGAILAVFQGLPVSPGSLTRGTYVVYLMVKERNIRNYWIAVLVSYWHYVGYLGFPLQMVKEFPSLARFMGGRWATRMVRIIPVFGEHGALLEHWIFDLFFNVPLSIKRKFTRRKEAAPQVND